MPSTAFIPSIHGFPVANAWPPGTPILTLPTPFGRVRIGDASAGVCGGMVFAALDLFHHEISVPPTVGDDLFRYFVRRLFASWNVPIGGARYFDWQRRRDLHRPTVEREWPKIRALLDAGTPVPLGIMKVRSWNPRLVGRNHQVLAVGYDVDRSGVVTVHVYDPNYPSDDGVSLSVHPARPGPVRHSREGDSVRGFFLTRYRRPASVPRFSG